MNLECFTTFALPSNSNALFFRTACHEQVALAAVRHTITSTDRCQCCTNTFFDTFALKSIGFLVQLAFTPKRTKRFFAGL